jgi:hypothetical protein
MAETTPALPPAIAALVRALEQAAIEHGAGQSRGMTMVLARAALEAEIATLAQERDELRAALEKIARREGRFSRDPLTHAQHCIEDMGALADAALAARTPTGGTPT